MSSIGTSPLPEIWIMGDNEQIPSDEPATRIIESLRDPRLHTSAELLPAVYNQLRQLARQHLVRLLPGQTIQPTALVHEAYMRLIQADRNSARAGGEPLRWDNRGHFFAAAAVVMRNTLVDQARRRARLKRGGQYARVRLDESGTPADTTIIDADLSWSAPGPAVTASADGHTKPDLDIEALDASLRRLEARDPRKADIVMLRFFAGLTVEQVALALNISPRTVDRDWKQARAWLFTDMQSPPHDTSADTTPDVSGP